MADGGFYTECLNGDDDCYQSLSCTDLKVRSYGSKKLSHPPLVPALSNSIKMKTIPQNKQTTYMSETMSAGPIDEDKRSDNARKHMSMKLQW